MRFDNRVTQLLGVDIPILQAPMGYIAKPALVALRRTTTGRGDSSGEQSGVVASAAVTIRVAPALSRVVGVDRGREVSEGRVGCCRVGCRPRTRPRCDRSTWVSRTTNGIGVGTEIRSTAVATGARSCEVTVTFRAPNGRSETAAKLGRSYARLYERLYDEDEDRPPCAGGSTGRPPCGWSSMNAVPQLVLFVNPQLHRCLRIIPGAPSLRAAREPNACRCFALASTLLC